MVYWIDNAFCTHTELRLASPPYLALLFPFAHALFHFNLPERPHWLAEHR